MSTNPQSIIEEHSPKDVLATQIHFNRVFGFKLDWSVFHTLKNKIKRGKTHRWCQWYTANIGEGLCFWQKPQRGLLIYPKLNTIWCQKLYTYIRSHKIELSDWISKKITNGSNSFQKAITSPYWTLFGQILNRSASCAKLRTIASVEIAKLCVGISIHELVSILHYENLCNAWTRIDWFHK